MKIQIPSINRPRSGTENKSVDLFMDVNSTRQLCEIVSEKTRVKQGKR